MSFVFDAGLAALAQGVVVGWHDPDPDAVRIGFAINYGTPFDVFNPPPFVPPPTPTTVPMIAHSIPLTGRTVVGGKAYSAAASWINLPDSWGADHWFQPGPGGALSPIWDSYWPLVAVYGIVVSLQSGNIPLIFRDDPGVTGIDLSGDNSMWNSAGGFQIPRTYQDVTFDPGSLPWLEFSR